MRFNSPCRNVTYDAATELFSVTVHDHTKDTIYTELFDHVVVATGHFSTPNVPWYPGFDSFGGRVLHAHDFRDALEFKGKDVLFMGSSYSAEDIASQCYKYGAKSITLSSRSDGLKFHWPDNFERRVGVDHVAGNTVTFTDGSTKQVDAIILCTGYKHFFPFMADDLRLECENRLWVQPLYKGVLWIDNPKLVYLGMQDQFYTFNMFDAQAWYARDVIMGRIEAPNKAAMQTDSDAWLAREEKLETDSDMIWYQGDYTQDLIDATDYPNFDIAGVNRTFEEWEGHKHNDIMGFRNKSFKSLISGTQSPPHHTPWLDALDDSLESYLDN
ncbi:MAG TPA: potassium transporter [Oceanospirillaceae bacterium]|nr:potassium transporter [Oceanospirillaceae bacterium]